ncbi:hypothetical protein DPMN_104095 [Dreissena polymorpha]|uniref:Uncharacterized protein n=1 Tax=Dreissena polymorpha TaxID=45954 RepID=A0A9D4JZR9_DREPO|nr:hypothetical protein DPMN_104095 [Dreissena polymorpha]
MYSKHTLNNQKLQDCIVNEVPHLQALVTVFDVTTAVVACEVGRMETALWKNTPNGTQTASTSS